MQRGERWRLCDVELDGVRSDVRLRDGRVAEITARELTPGDGERVLHAGGGALLPGLADHHLHLHALAAAAASVDLHGAATLAGAHDEPEGADDDWLRVIGAGAALTRAELDARWPGRAVRVQHRSGRLWTLSSAAIAGLGPGLTPQERDTGQLWGADERLGALLAAAGHAAVGDVPAVGRRLAAWGVTHVTDATPELSAGSLAGLRAAVDQHVVSMAGPGDGPRKLVLADHEAPDLAGLVARIRAAHAAARPVAIHTVTATTLALALAGLQGAGVRDGDRLEHCAVCDDAAARRIAGLGLRVVTQPTIYARHASAFVAGSPPRERALLWRIAGLRDAGVRVAVSSDAPYGDADPGATLAACAARRTEGIPAASALATMLADPLDAGGPPRRVVPGAPADLCLLSAGLADALGDAAAGRGWTARATFVDGRRIAVSENHLAV